MKILISSTVLATLLVFCPLLSGQYINECKVLKKCDACISASAKCGWCKDELYSANFSGLSMPSDAQRKVYRQSEQSYYDRCDYTDTHVTQNCKDMESPRASNRIDEGSPLQGETRVSPQRISVNLRVGESTTVTVQVKTPKDFPVDLYYLMDLSESMADDLNQIKNLGQILSQEMKKVTSNFRLGFGAFVDKPLPPYTKTEPQEVLGKIASGLQYTFGFKNYLPLDEDPTAFRRVVDRVKVSFNEDIPEGSLDALMQATVCEKDIGWRDKIKARRIIILTTDAPFHSAGDGLLGGVVTPNDGACHVRNGNYTASKTMDYPSLSYLKQVMIDNEVVPIFATTNNPELYKRVADFFGEQSGAVADNLEKDSSNVVPLIKEAYEKIAKFVKISVEPIDDVDVKFQAICGKGKVAKDAVSCNDVALGEEVEFKVTFTAKACSQKLLKKDSFLIKTSFGNVYAKLKVFCSCECSNASSMVYNATVCHKRGTLKCGECFCYSAFEGRFCHCVKDPLRENTTLCRVRNPISCSGRGYCDCGDCLCYPSQKPNEVFYGKDCQCSNASCLKSFGEFCGGPSRGECQCGQCICTPDWTGPACGTKCLNSTAACFKDGVECNGQGECSCGKCSCYRGYVGPLCEQCIANCPDPCEDYKECIRCSVFQTGNLKGSACDAECERKNVTSITKVDFVESAAEGRCVVSDDDDCSFVFTYTINNVTKESQVLVQKERICPAEPDILAIILGVIAGIVGIGLALLLIWKLLATIKDRREFAKFEKDRENARWQTGENPIFKQATSTFQNPLYGGQ